MPVTNSCYPRALKLHAGTFSCCCLLQSSACDIKLGFGHCSLLPWCAQCLSSEPPMRCLYTVCTTHGAGVLCLLQQHQCTRPLVSKLPYGSQALSTSLEPTKRVFQRHCHVLVKHKKVKASAHHAHGDVVVETGLVQTFLAYRLLEFLLPVVLSEIMDRDLMHDPNQVNCGYAWATLLLQRHQKGCTCCWQPTRLNEQKIWTTKTDVLPKGGLISDTKQASLCWLLIH